MAPNTTDETMLLDPSKGMNAEVLVLLEAGMLGMMVGCRLWAHRSYKAKFPLQIILDILVTLQSKLNQYTAYDWARDHRLHHRHSDTDGDPYNATRGFFFSHVDWLPVHKHPELKRRAVTLDLSDSVNNPVLAFQKLYGLFIIVLFAYVLPTLCPMSFWGETFNNAWHVNVLRMVVGFIFVSLVNSLVNAVGNRPYDKEVMATDNMGGNLVTLGEGFHNYLHVFPWDYRGAELIVSRFNVTAAFIEFFAWIGWAYDLKTVEHGLVVTRAKRCGDGTHKNQEMQCDTTVCKNE